MTAGEQLRERLVSRFTDNDLEPDGPDCEIIDRAVKVADTIADLESVVEADGRTISGSRGQTVIHPAVSEIRQHQLVLARLMRSIDFKGDNEVSASEKARKAASARWASQAPSSPVRALPEAK